MAAAPLFDAYDFEVLNVPYFNGTTNKTYKSIMATPSTENAPLILIYGSPYSWSEVRRASICGVCATPPYTQTTFLRYGIGALRRSYGVVMVRQPGQAGEGVPNASQPLVFDYTNLTLAVLEAIRDNATLAPRVDLNNVTLMGIALASYGTARACSSLSDQLRACVLSPPMHDVGAAIGSAVSRLLLSPMTLAANATPKALPSDDMVRACQVSCHSFNNLLQVAAFKSPASVTTALLTNCSASSGAPDAFGALFRARGVDQEIAQTVQMAMVCGRWF